MTREMAIEIAVHTVRNEGLAIGDRPLHVVDSYDTVSNRAYWLVAIPKVLPESDCEATYDDDEYFVRVYQDNGAVCLIYL